VVAIADHDHRNLAHASLATKINHANYQNGITLLAKKL